MNFLNLFRSKPYQPDALGFIQEGDGVPSFPPFLFSDAYAENLRKGSSFTLDAGMGYESVQDIFRDEPQYRVFCDLFLSVCDSVTFKLVGKYHTAPMDGSRKYRTRVCTFAIRKMVIRQTA